MVGTPEHIDVDDMQGRLLAISGISAVHDLYVRRITSGMDAMSCHFVVGDLSQGPSRLLQARALLKSNFGIDHVTVQVEDEAFSSEEVRLYV